MKDIQIKPVEYKKKMDKSMSTGITAKEIIEAMQQTTDVKEKLLKDLTDKLFDKKNLLMISRLDNNLAFYVIKHLIIDGFYAKFYSQIESLKTVYKLYYTS